MVQHLLFTNNATSRLYAAVAPGDTTIRVEAGDGALFPQPAEVDDVFMVTLEDRRSGQIEICVCTARSGDIMTVTRAQEGTLAQAFAIGATVSHRLTAASLTLLASAAGVPEAPIDGKIYGRQSEQWIESVTKALYTSEQNAQNSRLTTLEGEMNTEQARNDAQDVAIANLEDTYAEDAPADGYVYARQNNAWVVTIDKVTFDTTIADLTGRTATLEADMSEVQLDVASLESQVTALQSTDSAHEARMTDIENKNVDQDSVINTKIGDAPSDGVQYVRKDANWSPVDIPPGTVISETPPSDPETGQMWWKASTGETFIWDGDSWELMSSPAVVISDTPPTAPKDGDLWWESDSGTLLVYYADADSEQWVEATKPGAPGAPGPLVACVDAPPVSPQVGQMWWDSDSGRLFIWYDDGNSKQWVQISGPLQQPVPGSYKISEGTGSGNQVLFTQAIPTGYSSLEIYLNELVASMSQTVELQFSWDGGATWPQAANEYYWSYFSHGNTAASGTVQWASGTRTRGYIIPTLGTGSSKKGNAKIVMPLGANHPSYRSEADYYNGANYIALYASVFASQSAAQATHFRVLCSSGTIAGKWQVNGIK